MSAPAHAERSDAALALAAACGDREAFASLYHRYHTVSTELHVVVLSTRSDPRSGDMLYRLTNVVRGEPALELFQVPADYQIQDMKPLSNLSGIPQL